MEFESVSGYHLGPTRKQLEPRNWHLQLLFVLFLKRKFHKIKFWGSKQKCFLHYRESPGSMLQNCCKLQTAAKHLLTGKNRLAVRSGLRKWRKKSFPPERDKDHKGWSPVCTTVEEILSALSRKQKVKDYTNSHFGRKQVTRNKGNMEIQRS